MTARAHGTRACYQYGPTPGWPGGCRCARCRAAQAATIRRQRGIQVAHIDAARVRTHLLELEARGIGTRQVAQAAGVSRQTVCHLRDGRRRRCRSDVAQRILTAFRVSWPFEPLLDELGRPPMTQAARRLGVSTRQLYRWRDGGLSTTVADRAAMSIGSHPALIWAEW